MGLGKEIGVIVDDIFANHVVNSDIRRANRENRRRKSREARGGRDIMVVDLLHRVATRAGRIVWGAPLHDAENRARHKTTGDGARSPQPPQR